MHLRLLDDFLGIKRSHPLDVGARDWVPTWTPTKGWLKPDIRKRINWQVAHLSRKRATWFDWEIRSSVYSCCQQLESFVAAVKKYRPDRAPAFAVTEGCIADGLKCLEPE